TARDGDLTRPRAHRGDTGVLGRARAPMGGRDHHRADPGIVRRTLVAASAAQPERADPQGTAALPRANRRDVDAVPPRISGGDAPLSPSMRPVPWATRSARFAVRAAPGEMEWRGADV